MFNKYKILHGLPKEGQIIKYTTPTKHHWFTNVIEDEKNLLTLGQEYTVKHVELNSSSTHVWLDSLFTTGSDKYDNPMFNMSAFEWTKPEINLEDLKGFSPMDLSSLNHSYGWGIEFDGEVWLEGIPMLVVEYETKRLDSGRYCDIITKAYFKK